MAAAEAQVVAVAPLTTRQKTAVARAARAFTTYGDAKKAMAKIAKSIVSLRLTFEKDGRPDYRGETPGYRGAVSALYEKAIPDADERDSFKVAIRYWVAKEFDARVESGAITKAELAVAGLERANRTTPAASRNGTSPTRSRTGVLSPADVVSEAERILTEHVNDDVIGVVEALQHVGRELGPIVAGLRDEEVRGRAPGRALLAASEQLLSLALDAAHLGGVEVGDYVAEWIAEIEEVTAT